MKTMLRPVLLAGSLAAVLPLLRAADESPKATSPESNKEMRVIVGHDAGGPAQTFTRHMLVSHAGSPAEMETIAFLGIETSPAPAALAAQLNLPENTALVVAHVAAGSPAAAVLKENDVLLKLDDQILIDQRQLSVLIRNHKENDEVTLTYLRGGKEATAKARLAKHEMPKAAFMLERMPGGATTIGPGGVEFALPPGAGLAARAEADRVLGLMHESLSETPGRMRIEHQGGTGVRATRINPENSNLTYSDDEGALELTVKAGQKTLVAKNAKGEQVFSGPVTTEAERKAMPPAVRARLEKLEGMQDMTFRTDSDFRGGETRVVRPQGRGVALPPGPLTSSPAQTPHARVF